MEPLGIRSIPVSLIFYQIFFLVPKRLVLKPRTSLCKLKLRIYFKMHNIPMAINFVSARDYIVSLDTKEGCFSVPVFSSSPQIFAIFFGKSIDKNFFRLLFGYNLAPGGLPNF